MRGTIDILRPNQPGEFRLVNQAVSNVGDLVNGLPSIIPYWDQWINWAGVLVPAVVIGNDDWQMPIQPFNLPATAVWHYFAGLKGIRLASQVTGPVVVFTGDEEFLDALY